jgi:exonuclease III
MKLICNNIWGGRIHEPFVRFVAEQAEGTDIFCFQEVFHHGKVFPGHEESKMEIFSEISRLLPAFNGYQAPPGTTEESLAIFARKSLDIDEEGFVFVLGPGETDNRALGIPLQYLSFRDSGKKFTICNFHGWWCSGTKKMDTPERLKQSEKVSVFLESIDGAKVLCGDFNLSPDTKSITILENKMKNLIKEYGVTSTRSNFYPKENKFADYMLVSPDIDVKDFRVLEVPVSDHFPLLLEFS